MVVRLSVLGSCAVRLPLAVGKVVGGVGCVSALCVRFGAGIIFTLFEKKPIPRFRCPLLLV